MGFWFGSIVFLLLELVGFFTVKGVYSNQDSRSSRFHKQNTTLLPQVLVATAVFCSWMMWTIVYIGQMYPLVNPVLSG